jgi:hypothetical protein
LEGVKTRREFLYLLAVGSHLVDLLVIQSTPRLSSISLRGREVVEISGPSATLRHQARRDNNASLCLRTPFTHAHYVAGDLLRTYAGYSNLLRCCLAHAADVAGMGALMGEGEMGAIAFRLHVGMARLTMTWADEIQWKY